MMAKAECCHGHPYTPENTYMRVRGDRECRTCRRERKQRRRDAGVDHDSA
jgi:hypothetical protein